MTIKIRKTKSGFTITAKGLKSGVRLRDFVMAQGFESGANAADNSPALESAAATRTATTEGKSNV